MLKIKQATRVAWHINKFINSSFSKLTRAGSRTPAAKDNLQFSKKRLIDFGELPYGQIPTALQYSTPTTYNKLSNGVAIATESFVGNQAAVTVAVKVGTRQQNISNSSVSQFVARVSPKGTISKSKSELDGIINNLGGNIKIEVTRQMTYYTMFILKDNVIDAVNLLADIIKNPTFDNTQVQSAKQHIYRSANSMNPKNNIINNLHYTSFRDHALGQPDTGIKDNVYSITAEQVKQFHQKYYVGENIVVSAAGQINAQQLNEAAASAFGSIKPKVEGQIQNSQMPMFTPSLMFQRDDQLSNTSAGAAFLAPTWNDPDFFTMTYFKRIIGEFRVDKYTGAHLNASKLQYNSFHEDLGDYPDLIIHQPFYVAYTDVGLFGNFLFGNEIWNRPMVLLSQNKMSTYAQYINQTQVFRARNKYFNDLLEQNDPVIQTHRNSKQAAYLDRLVSRTEIATRISAMDPQYISNVASKWFWDKETSITAWGPLHNLIIDAHYARQYRRATLGQYSMLRAKFDY